MTTPALDMKLERETHQVVMLAFPDAQILDITGPLEVFARTSRWIDDHVSPGRAAYSVELVAEEAGPVRTSSGLEITATRSYRDIERADTLLVTGGTGYPEVAKNSDLLAWLRATSAQSGRTGSICNGALILAASGLLNGRQATTHWNFCAELARMVPDCRVMADAIHVRDGNIYTSAGVTAGMDLALALVEEDWGRSIALRVAQELVMFLVRPGGQSQFSRHLRAQQREDGFGELELWMMEHLDQDLTVERLADVAGMSRRNFSRRFNAAFGCPPAAHVMRLRIERARHIIETRHDRRLKDVTRECGFQSEQNLRRAFLRMLGLTPEDYRARFGAVGQRG